MNRARSGVALTVVLWSLALAGPLVGPWGSTLRAQTGGEDVPGHGKINWTEKTITVTGTGAPNLKSANVAAARAGAERAAKLDAFRNILEAVKGVKVTGTQTAGQAMDSSPAMRTKVEGVIQGFKVLDTKYYSDGGVDVIVQVALAGVTDALVGEAGSTSTSSAAGNETTGVIINAVGLGVVPGLAPRILDEKGTEVYAASFVSRDAIKRFGVCGYHSSLDAAKKDARLGAKPVVIKAMRAADKGSADLVLAQADAQKLGTLSHVLREGNVVIVAQ